MSDESWRPSSDQTFSEVEKQSPLWLARFDAHRLEVRILICLNWLMDGYFVNRRQFLIRVNDRRMGLEVPNLTVLAREIPVGSTSKDQFDRTALEAAQQIASMIEAEASQLSNSVEIVELRGSSQTRV